MQVTIHKFNKNFNLIKIKNTWKDFKIAHLEAKYIIKKIKNLLEILKKFM